MISVAPLATLRSAATVEALAPSITQARSGSRIISSKYLRLQRR